MDVLAISELQHLDDKGYLVLEGLVPPARVMAMRARLEELLTVTPQDHAGTLVVAGLLEEEVFDDAWSHPRVLAAVRHVLGDGSRLTGVASRGLRPGHGEQALHADWGKHDVKGVWYGCNVICALVDFTEDNGATRVLPGSHRSPKMLNTRHDPRKRHPAQRQFIGAAGTIFILNIHCLHSAVLNSSNGPRHALFTCFSRRDSPLILANALPVADPSPKTLARFNDEVQSLLKG